MPDAAITLRPLTDADVPAALAVTRRAFEDLARRTADAAHGDQTPPTAEQAVHAARRIAHLIDTDPGGAWAAENGADGTLGGVALGLRREDLFGLSLLVVDPALQSRGAGRRLLDAALAYGADCHAGIILSSADARALRCYATSGYTIHPHMTAWGEVDPRRLPAITGVHSGGAADHGLVRDVDRFVRGASRDADLAVLHDRGADLLVIDDHRGRGYAFADGGKVALLAATTPRAAQELLRAVLATVPGGGRAVVEALTAMQPWAFEVVLEAGLHLSHVTGATLVRGDPGPMTPYLPSGAFL